MLPSPGDQTVGVGPLIVIKVHDGWPVRGEHIGCRTLGIDFRYQAYVIQTEQSSDEFSERIGGCRSVQVGKHDGCRPRVQS
ncbi:hypothetical protein SUDANB25_00641 [Streptomyces sp. SudanB25_2051]